MAGKNVFPLPRIQDCLDAISGVALCSILHLTSSHHQTPVGGDNIAKRKTKLGLCKCIYMPFGLWSAPATFQRVLELGLCFTFVRFSSWRATSVTDNAVQRYSVMDVQTERPAHPTPLVSLESCYYIKRNSYLDESCDCNS